jgi:hypothetical protein
MVKIISQFVKKGRLKWQTDATNGNEKARIAALPIPSHAISLSVDIVHNLRDDRGV